MHATFQIGDVFPAESTVAKFLTQLCIVTNDLTLANELVGREFQEGGRVGISNYFLWLLSSYYREGAKFLDHALADAEVQEFVAGLSDETRAHLAPLQASVTPLRASFVWEKLKPVRDVTFHYFDPRDPDVANLLGQAAGIRGKIELGGGTFQETRYEFADEVLLRHILSHWGGDESSLEAVMSRLVQLVLSWTYFTHGCVAEYLAGIDQTLLVIDS